MDITQEHPEYRAAQTVLNKYWDLYIGGDHLRARSHLYLEQRQKEPLDVYSERLAKVFYENYIGSIIDWYAATLFRREPRINFVAENDSERDFYALFVEDCDQRGSSLTAFLRRLYIQAMVYGQSYALIDMPRCTGKLTSRGEEDREGVSRAYLVDYSPANLINWSRDSQGAFEWIVLRQHHTSCASAPGDPHKSITEWLYFDKTSFQIYRQYDPKEQPGLVAEGHHSLAHKGAVPLFEFRLSDGLWLMQKAALLQIEHFNKSNGLAWALSMGLYAMPVIYSDRTWNQVMGESYYIQLAPNDRFGWTEPEGHVYQIASENLQRLKEEIYRVCYLMSQGRPLSTADTTQSGISRQREFFVTQSILRAYGDLVKDFSKTLLRNVAVSRLEPPLLSVEGLDDFDIGDFSSDINDAERLLKLQIPSATLMAQIYKRLASQYLCDLPQEIKNRINSEIELAVAPSERY
jgi:hypothetical protein